MYYGQISFIVLSLVVTQYLLATAINQEQSSTKKSFRVYQAWIEWQLTDSQAVPPTEGAYFGKRDKIKFFVIKAFQNETLIAVVSKIFHLSCCSTLNNIFLKNFR